MISENESAKNFYGAGGGSDERDRLVELNSEVSLALVESHSLRGSLQLCAEAVVRHLDAAFARIWTLDRTGKRA